MSKGISEKVQLEPIDSRVDWESLCENYPEATAFHRYDFLEVIASAIQCRFVPLAISFRGTKVGVAPLLLKQLGPFCTINWAPFPYLGPLVPSALVPATLSALTKEAARRRALNHQESFPHTIIAAGLSSFTAHNDRTFVVPLKDRSDEDLMAAMHPGRRSEIRKAQRSGFEICTSVAEDFRSMDIWNEQVYAAQGMPPAYAPGTYNRVFQALRSARGVSFSSARLNGNLVGVQIYIATSRRDFMWQCGTDPAYKSAQALLMWRRFIEARDDGLSEVDLVGTPNEGIAHYKKRFGAVERHYSVMQSQARSYQLALSAIAGVKNFPKMSSRAQIKLKGAS